MSQPTGAPRPAPVRTMTTSPTDAAPAWTCPICFALVLGEHQDDHERFHDVLGSALRQALGVDS